VAAVQLFSMGNGASIEPYDGNELDAPVSARQSQKVVGQGESSKGHQGAVPVECYAAAQTKVTVTSEEDRDDSITDILFQFIPYYGQGDQTNDGTVRATLSCLSVEDIDCRDAYGNTLLLLACTYHCEDLVRIMLNKGADPNAVNTSGATSLHFACYGDTASMVIAKGLLQNGANPEVAESTYGCTPLHYAASSGNMDLCKLLLSHGAVVNTVCHYNWTCVDYARQAGMADAAVYLQQKLDQHHMQYQYRGGFGQQQMMPLRGMYGGAQDGIQNWSAHTDISSGTPYVYYVNDITGESLWEQDWKLRMSQLGSSPNMNSFPVTTSGSALLSHGSDKGATNAASQEDKKKQKKSVSINVTAKKDAWLSSQAMKTRLVAFFGKHDPIRLPEIDSILKDYKGREMEMVKDLCAKYNVSEEVELAAFKSKYQETKEDPSCQESSAASGTSGKFSILGAMKSMMGGSSSGERPASDSNADGKGIDSLQLQALIKEERAKIETKLNEERDSFKVLISEKDGLISKAYSDLELVKRETTRLKVETQSMTSRLKNSADHGDHVLNNARDELQAQRKQLDLLKKCIEAEAVEVSAKSSVLDELEEKLSTLTAGNEDQIAKENAKTQEREKQTRETEQRRRAEISALEEKKKAMETKAKQEIGKLRSDYKKAEEEEMTVFNKLRKGLEIEIDSLNRELADIKSRYAKEITSANITAENCKKVCDEAVRRMTTAEDLANSMQAEVTEAKQVQGFNSQLTKYGVLPSVVRNLKHMLSCRDLNREQQTRKKLHNEMEDMKGKIRVYVRVRPLSKTETEKRCQIAAVRDSKTSINIKNPDGTIAKSFEFDQVFAGSENNSQVDIFRDTKHLVMSVLDGFNVCIFAYGQTGAGKVGELPYFVC
jgi:hypothetical protein